VRPQVADRPLFPVNRCHLDALGGELGIWQHATGSSPNEEFGYCTDDVARALTVDLLHARQLGWDPVRASAWRSLLFLSDAFDPATGRFRNFRDRHGAWLDGAGSEDCHGRALLALGTVLAEAPDDAEAVDQARALFLAALPATRLLHSPRAIASVVLACTTAGASGPDGTAEDRQPVIEELARGLHCAFAGVETQSDWPWPEAVLTYENALLPRALIAAGAELGDTGMTRTGLAALDWLIGLQVTAGGRFSPIGNKGWWPQGGTRNQFDQQPIEATAMILAAEDAFRCTGEKRYLRTIEAAYGWFLGDNDAAVPLAGEARGACRDGLTSQDASVNEGAESTLMWLTALEHVRAIRSATAARPRRGSRWSGTWGDAALSAPRVARASTAAIEVTRQSTGARGLFQRHPNNPIITAAQLPYPANAVFNPGASRLGEDTLLLLRVEDFRGMSHLLVARSSDGVTNWRFDTAPLLGPEPEGKAEEIWGCEDARLTWLPELGEWVIAYTAYSKFGPLVALATTTDFKEVRRIGPVLAPENKDAALFPRRMNGRWVMIHRPSPHRGGAHMWISHSPDLRHWGDPELLFEARDGAWWDAGKIGLGPPPLETTEGWLVCYHGVRATASGSIYRVGLALLDLEDPRVVLRRTDEWVLGPAAPYEVGGDVGNVIFPTGWVYDASTSLISMYYGAADSVVGLATARLDELLEYMRRAPIPHARTIRLSSQASAATRASAGSRSGRGMRTPSGQNPRAGLTQDGLLVVPLDPALPLGQTDE
jgi:predicted GH43/DUF377 family glycosyl hydrolase